MTAYTKAQAVVYDGDRFASKGGQLVHDREASMLISALSLLSPNSRVLDVACGTGRMMLLARDAKMRVTGIDSSEAMLSENPMMAVCGDALALPFDAFHFDLVYSFRFVSLLPEYTQRWRALNQMAIVSKRYVLANVMQSFRPKYRKRNMPQSHIYPALNGFELVWRRSAMFFGIPVLMKAPVLNRLDCSLCRLFPSMANQRYYLFDRERKS